MKKTKLIIYQEINLENLSFDNADQIHDNIRYYVPDEIKEVTREYDKEESLERKRLIDTRILNMSQYLKRTYPDTYSEDIELFENYILFAIAENICDETEEQTIENQIKAAY